MGRHAPHEHSRARHASGVDRGREAHRVHRQGRRARSALPTIGPAQYDAIDDDWRFVVLPPASDDREMVLVLDWFLEIRAKVAVAGR